MSENDLPAMPDYTGEFYEPKPKPKKKPKPKPKPKPVMTGEEKVVNSAVCAGMVHGKGFTVGGYVPDFINKDKKRIIEIYHPDRFVADVKNRTSAFYAHGYETLFIAGVDFARKPDSTIKDIVRRFCEKE